MSSSTKRFVYATQLRSKRSRCWKRPVIKNIWCNNIITYIGSVLLCPYVCKISYLFHFFFGQVTQIICNRSFDACFDFCQCFTCRKLYWVRVKVMKGKILYLRIFLKHSYNLDSTHIPQLYCKQLYKIN